MTSLSLKQIDALTAILEGKDAIGRSSTKGRAEGRFAQAYLDRFGTHLSPTYGNEILAISDFDAAKATLQAIMEPPVNKPQPEPEPEPEPEAQAKPERKISPTNQRILDLVTRPQGATRRELMDATGWANVGTWYLSNPKTHKGLAEVHGYTMQKIEGTNPAGRKCQAYRFVR